MQVKLFEIRDRATMIAAIAVRASLADKQGEDLDARRFLLGSAGINGDDVVFFGRLDDVKLTYAPEDWGPTRTMPAAHRYIAENFDALHDGQVIDVRVILGEASDPVPTDRTAPIVPPQDEGAAS